MIPKKMAAGSRGVHGAGLYRALSTKGVPAMGLILLIVIIVLLVGSAPRWPHSRDWGYGPSGGLGLVLVIVLLLLLLGYIPARF